ncbi:MAG: DUF2304 family protein [Candidatus Gracilibacteria bacterium]|nr:DUF2304 family protein [Candidatus Gracilibacteria bacterium]
MTLLDFFFTISGIIILILALDIANKQKFNALHFLVFISIGGGLLIFTYFPNVLNDIGNVFGVARGADVLVYASIIFLLYFVLLLLGKHVGNKEDITQLVRGIALEFSAKNEINGKEVFVIPAYNEGKVVYHTVKNILDSGYKNIIVVNDGSKDNTRHHLEKFGDKIILLNHLKNRGQGAALETGFEYVRRYGNIDYVITYDADGQHSLEDLKSFEKILKEHHSIDVLLGSRFLGKKEVGIPFVRRMVLKLGILFTFFISNINLTDTHNGYRVIRTKILDKIRITQDGMTHASEILDIISCQKIPYKEVPVTIKYTEYSLKKGQSSGNAINIAVRILWNKFFR